MNVSVVDKKSIILSNHAQRRLTERRQDGVTEWDVYAACHKASEILVKGVPSPLKLGGFKSKEQVCFDITVVDSDDKLLIITVIGHKYNKRKRDCMEDTYRLHNLPYKKRMKEMKKRRKEEMKWYK